MAAADDLELDAHAIRDLDEMQRGMAAASARCAEGTPVPVRLLVQVDRAWPPRPQRVEVTGTGVTLLDGNSADDNMGRGTGLQSFLDWARTAAPAEHFFLVLWGHAYGLGFGRDHGDPLTLIELQEALRFLKGARGGRKLDLLGANACAMSYVEAAFQLQDDVERLVASQIAVPFAGWPYEAILRAITSSTTPDALGKLVVDRYVGHFHTSPDGEQVSMALVNPTKAGDLKQAIDALATEIDTALSAGDPVSDRFTHLRSAFLAATAGDVRPLIDLADLCHKVGELCDDLTLVEKGVADPPKPTRSAAARLATHATAAEQSLQDLREAAAAVLALLAPWGGSLDPDQDDAPSGVTGFVIHHERHADLHGLHGVGIFAPCVTDEGDLERLGLAARTRDATQPPSQQVAYHSLAFAQGGPWERLVFTRLKAELPAGVMADIEGTGATSRGDRAAVAQMLTSVDSAFTILERRLEATRIRTLAEPPRPGGTAKPSMPKPLPPHALGAFGALRLIPLADLKELQPKATDGTAGIEAANETPVVVPPRVATAVEALAKLETMIAGLERAIRSTVTNAAFGLGPGIAGTLGKRDLGKRDLGKRDLGKRDLGKRDLGKRDLGKRDLGKRDLGGSAFGSLFAEPSAETIVAGLFEEVSDALQRLEASTASFELALAESLVGGTPVPGLPAAVRASQARSKAHRALRLLGEATVDARRTLRRVLGDPVYGFGPGPAGLNAEDRRELARAAGMNGETLVLL